MAMICVVYLPGKKDGPPCIAQYTRRVQWHVGVRTWCDKEIDASSGVFQVPDEMRVCETCTAELDKFKAKLAAPARVGHMQSCRDAECVGCR